MDYSAPLAAMALTLRHAGGLDARLGEPEYAEIDREVVDAVLNEAARFAREALAPLNRVSDQVGAKLVDGAVVTPPGFRAAYDRWREGGWNGVSLPATWGGMEMPTVVGVAVMEMWTSACMAFALQPVVSQGAVEVLLAHGAPALQALYVPRLVSGEWTAAMALTEAQSGSDLSAIRTRATPDADGGFRLFGEKIFITYGDHDLTDNIVHFVLARLPEAPPGTRGLSLFLTPKFLVQPDGSLGARNDFRCAGVEHKLGIHGAPTCTMVYGEGEGEGARAWLVGEPHDGLACMFTLMNRARLATGMQGVAVGERAFQQAIDFARSRRQGRSPLSDGPAPHAIVEHPDVRRMLMTMHSLVAGARALGYAAGAAIDAAHTGPVGERAAQAARAGLLTPLVKAFASEVGFEAASIGVQVHGGMGFVEETGAAQHLRDARVTPIYEGANGIQAIDLVTRKILRDGGGAARAEAALYAAAAAQAASVESLGGTGARLAEGVRALEAGLDWCLAPGRPQAELLASATPMLRLFGLVAAGGCLARTALGALGEEPEAQATQVLAASLRFFADHLLVQAPALAETVIAGAAAVNETDSLWA